MPGRILCLAAPFHLFLHLPSSFPCSASRGFPFKPASSPRTNRRKQRELAFRTRVTEQRRMFRLERTRAQFPRRRAGFHGTTERRNFDFSSFGRRPTNTRQEKQNEKERKKFPREPQQRGVVSRRRTDGPGFGLGFGFVAVESCGGWHRGIRSCKYRGCRLTSRASCRPAVASVSQTSATVSEESDAPRASIAPNAAKFMRPTVASQSSIEPVRPRVRLGLNGTRLLPDV